jgi:hypothetical protein
MEQTVLKSQLSTTEHSCTKCKSAVTQPKHVTGEWQTQSADQILLVKTQQLNHNQHIQDKNATKMLPPTVSEEPPVPMTSALEKPSEKTVLLIQNVTSDHPALPPTQQLNNAENKLEQMEPVTSTKTV